MRAAEAQTSMRKLSSEPLLLAYTTHGGILMARPQGYKTFSRSTQLSIKFQQLIKTKYRQIKKWLALSPSDVVFIILIIVKTPTIVGVLTFITRINFVLS